jgi:DNA-binding CsgD family transcriptional regulator
MPGRKRREKNMAEIQNISIELVKVHPNNVRKRITILRNLRRASKRREYFKI